MKVLFVASTGGHLGELTLLRERMGVVDDEVWVTFPGQQARQLEKAGHRVQVVRDVAPRDWAAAMRSFPQAWRTVGQERPDVVVSTGAAVALPYLASARLRHRRAVYIESAARVVRPSLTGRVVRLLHAQTVSQSTSMGPHWPPVGSVYDAFEPTVRGLRPADRPLRVLVTLGTNKFAFTRLVARLEQVLPPDAEVVWQLGVTPPPAARPGYSTQELLPAEQLRTELGRCDVLVTHAGVGSTLDAFDAGLRPIVVPRRKAFGEHVDDHQAEISRDLATHDLALWREAGALTSADLLEAAGLGVARVVTPEPVDVRVGRPAPRARVFDASESRTPSTA